MENQTTRIINVEEKPYVLFSRWLLIFV